jgi:hypothetical protein
MAAALGAFTLAALVGGVLVIVASPPGSTRLALAVPSGAGLFGEPAMAVVRVSAPPPGTPLTVTVDGRSMPDTV